MDEQLKNFDYPTGAGGGGGNLAGAGAIRSTVLGSIEDLDPVLTRLAGYVEMLHTIEDGINGPRPRSVPGPGPDNIEKAIADSLINKVQSKRRQLVRLVDDIERSIMQINEGLWSTRS